MSYESLLRWYPKAWRDDNGAVYLAILEDDAKARGRSRPGFGEAWTIRLHGLTERATFKFAFVCAVLAFLSFSAPMVATMPERLSAGAVFISVTPALIAAVLVSRVLATGAFALAVVAALVRARRISASTALLAVSALLFCAATYGVDFAVVNFIGDSPGLILDVIRVGGPVAAAIGVAVVVNDILNRWTPSALRWSISLVAGSLVAFLWSVAVLQQSAALPLAAVALLCVMFTLFANSHGRSAQNPIAMSGATSSHSQRTAMRRFARAATFSGLVGGICLIAHDFNLTWADPWSASVLVVGALSPVPLVVTGGMLCRPLVGAVIHAASVLCWSGLVVLSAALASGPGMTTVQLLLASVLMMAGIALPFGRLLQRGRFVSICVSLGLGATAGLLVGTGVQQVLQVAPFVSAGAALWAFAWLQRQRAETNATPSKAATLV
ncbi:hypothetical protein [Pseudoclavibacter sp. VKM Ac-2888]|uniref:hypothetical protein n=1 Tax=Pseudoclavibacter sp. VKM Ac-2888 TaxID=2783830 RepID=UPI001889E519|nr:hypothetical protein [Pseudoclavibacter sp. VKM Ac-2888]MBF4549419.1 hypothetical protein [Pseudoclavibacter sp. VKM Ac-2888]